MKNESLIHIKLEYDEAVQSKRDVLSSEMNLIRIMKIIRRYSILRLKELKTKASLHRKIKENLKDIRSLQTILPKIEIPAILKKEEKIEIQEATPPKEKIYDNSLESELREIQEKLRALSE